MVVAALGWPRRFLLYCHIVSATVVIVAVGVGSAALFTWGFHPGRIKWQHASAWKFRRLIFVLSTVGQQYVSRVNECCVAIWFCTRDCMHVE